MVGTCSTCKNWAASATNAEARSCELLNRPGTVLVTANGQPVQTHRFFGCNLYLDKGFDLSEWHK